MSANSGGSILTAPHTYVAILMCSTTLGLGWYLWPHASRPLEPTVLPRDPVAIGHAATLGRPDARVAVIEFTDFQCPYCGIFARERFPGLRAKYIETGRVRWILKHLPLSFHSMAPKAAEAAECSRVGDRFWQMHDVMFQSQDQLDIESLEQDAKGLGLDVKAFHACLGGQMATRIEASMQEAARLSVVGTPTFLIGTIEGDLVKVTARLAGAKSEATFGGAIDRALAQVH